MLLRITDDEGGVIRLDGELDMASAKDLRTALRERDRRGPLVLDASRLTFMDSTGLSVLLEAARSRNGSGNLVLRDPLPAVRRVIEIAIPGGADGLEVHP